jgi:hypothetical protein
MIPRLIQKHSAAFLALFIAAAVLTMAPFAVALEIHHDLAAADHDGHEHSDTDLCQWVQFHTGHSLAADVPAPRTLLVEAPRHAAHPPILTSLSHPTSRASRAPPRF